MTNLLQVTNNNFNEILNSSDIAVINFSAPWCGPCRAFTPVLIELANNKPEISVGKVITDEEPDLSAAHAIRSIPTTIIYKNGKEVSKFTGAQSMKYFENILETL